MNIAIPPKIPPQENKMAVQLLPPQQRFFLLPLGGGF